MSKKTSFIVIGIVVLIAIVAVWSGGAWMWHKLLAMHGIH
jgi:hypothetical protein